MFKKCKSHDNRQQTAPNYKRQTKNPENPLQTNEASKKMKCGECGSKRFTVKSDDLVCNCCNMIITRIKQEQKQNLISNSKSVKEASKEVI